MANRIVAAIDAKNAEITGKLTAGTITQAQVDDASKTFNMDREEIAVIGGALGHKRKPDATDARTEKPVAVKPVTMKPVAEKPPKESGLMLVEESLHGQAGQFTTDIWGTIVNHGSKRLSYAQVTFNVYDASKSQVGTAIANVNGLEPSGKWAFHAVYFGTVNGEWTYKVDKLTGF